MNAEHARPMMAYVALCLAASYVLGQGVVGSGTSLGPIDIARAGEPVQIVRGIVTLTAVQEVLETGVSLVPAPVRGVVATSVTSSDKVRRVTNTVASTTPHRAPQHVAPAPTLSATPQASTPQAAAHGKASADSRKAGRIAARVAATGSTKADKPAKAEKPAKTDKARQTTSAKR